MKTLLKLKGFYDSAFEGNTHTLKFTLDSRIVNDFEFGEKCFTGVSSSSSISMSTKLKTYLGERVKEDKIDDMPVTTS